MAQINKSTDYFNTDLWTGNGTSQSISGLDFAPDWVWIKQRSGTRFHNLQDTIRGTGLQLFSNSTSADNSDSTNITAFNSDGYSLGAGQNVNNSSSTYVGWSWLGGGTGVSNTDGSITSTVSANTTSGFSIVTYTGSGTSSDTVGHGLGAVPALIIGKNRDSGARSWPVKHKDLSSNNTLFLNLTNAQASPGDGTFANLDNSSTFGFYSGSNADNVNQSGQNFIAYCFAEKKGFSKFGSYTGNGNADGIFVYTGFKPAWVMVKKSSGVNAWLIHDVKRSPLNPMDNQLFASSSIAEDTTSTNNNFDFLSNGFKARNTGDAYNGSGGTYIYMAFAESPLVGTNNIPATAR